MHIGIDANSGLVYEGSSAPEFPALPTPTVTQAKLIEEESDWGRLPGGLRASAFGWVFREDSFDPVTRTRRGRLYAPASNTQPVQGRVAPHPYEDPAGRAVGADGRLAKGLHSYMSCEAILAKPHAGKGATLVLGAQRAHTAWRILQTELLTSGDVMLTLQAKTAFGIIPEVNTAAIDEAYRQDIIQALDRVVASAFRETPISVVDHCRNAATMLISRWLAQQGEDPVILNKDLGEVIKVVERDPYLMVNVARLAFPVSRLHVRGKDTERIGKGLRSIVQEDADMALQVVGFIMREFGWAKS